MNCTSVEPLLLKPCYSISCTAKGSRCEPEEQLERGREVSSVLVLGFLKWRSVLKQNSSAEAHHSPATALRFRDKTKKISKFTSFAFLLEFFFPL